MPPTRRNSGRSSRIALTVARKSASFLGGGSTRIDTRERRSRLSISVLRHWVDSGTNVRSARLHAKCPIASAARFPVWMATTDPGGVSCSISQPARAALRSASCR